MRDGGEKDTTLERRTPLVNVGWRERVCTDRGTVYGCLYTKRKGRLIIITIKQRAQCAVIMDIACIYNHIIFVYLSAGPLTSRVLGDSDMYQNVTGIVVMLPLFELQANCGNVFVISV